MLDKEKERLSSFDYGRGKLYSQMTSPGPPTLFYEKLSALALLTVRIALVLRYK